ncbi:S-layer homology domain-containing protein [Candidatus Riflebacteria bacterium]
MFFSYIASIFLILVLPCSTFAATVNVPRHEFIARVVDTFDLSGRVKTAKIKVAQKKIYLPGLSAEHSSFPDVSLAIRLGLIRGFPDKGIHSQWAITREASAILLSRILRRFFPRVRSRQRFKDLKKGHWLYSYLKRSGNFFRGQNKFRPEDKLSRAEFNNILSGINKFLRNFSHLPGKIRVTKRNVVKKKLLSKSTFTRTKEQKSKTAAGKLVIPLKPQISVREKKGSSTEEKVRKNEKNHVSLAPTHKGETGTFMTGTNPKSSKNKTVNNALSGLKIGSGDGFTKVNNQSEVKTENDKVRLDFNVARFFPEHKVFFFLPENGNSAGLSKNTIKEFLKPFQLIGSFAEKLGKSLDEFEFNLLNPRISIEQFKNTEKVLIKLNREIELGLKSLKNTLTFMNDEKNREKFIEFEQEKSQLKILYDKFHLFEKRIKNDLKYIQSKTDLIEYVKNRSKFEALSIEKSF